MGASIQVSAGCAGDASPDLLSATVVQDWASVERLGQEWNALLRKSAADTIFLTWEWIHTWLDVSGRHSQPLVVVVRNGQGALVAIAPFYVCRYRFLSLFEYRVLRTVGDWPTGGEYPDLIVDQEVEEQALCCIAKALLQHRRFWDCIWMPKLAGWTGVSERLAQCGRHGRLHFRRREMYFGFLPLPASIREFEASFSADRRQQMRRKKKQLLAREGFAFGRCEDAASLGEYLHGLFDLHARRWSTRGQQGVFRRKPDEARFYEQFTPLALRAGWLRVYAAMEGGSLKAVQLGYVYNNVFLQMQEGFDPAYQAGVGNVLRHHVIEACIDEKLAAYDFLGEMSEHKSRWLAHKRTGYDIFMGHRSLRNLLLFALRVWPSGRFMRPVQQGGVAAAHPSASVAEARHGV